MEDELQKLQQNMDIIQLLLNFSKKGEINEEPPIDNWLSELKDVLYDAHEFIDLRRIESAKLLADQNFKSEPSPACYNFSPTFFTCFTSVPQRDETDSRIKELNDRINLIFENGKQFNRSTFAVTGVPGVIKTLMDIQRESYFFLRRSVVGGEVEAASNELVKLLITEKTEEKCRIFAIADMRGTGKTTLAQKIFDCPKMQNYFTFRVWVWVPHNYSEIDLLKDVIRQTKGNYGDVNTKSELQTILRDSLASAQSLFLVLDDVWRADVWVDLLRLPLQSANISVRVLVTTIYEDVAKVMKAACTHNVMRLSIESSWDMLRGMIIPEENKKLAADLKDIGLNIAEKCGGVPLVIKTIANRLITRERTRSEWRKFLMTI